MLILDTSGKLLEVVLNAVPSAELPWCASWVDVDAAFTPGSADGTTNGTTAVAVVSGPALAGVTRKLQFLSIHNVSNARQRVVLRVNNSGSYRTVLDAMLDVSEQIQFTDADGFQAMDSDGCVKSLALEPLAVSSIPYVSAVGLTSVERVSTQKGWPEMYSPGTGFQTANEVYFVYQGRVTRERVGFAPPSLPLEAYVCEVGVGRLANTVALLAVSARSPAGISEAGFPLITIARVTAPGMDSSRGRTRTGGSWTPTNGFQGLAVGMHLWAGLSLNYSSTYPQLAGFMYDDQRSTVLVAPYSTNLIYYVGERPVQTGAAPVVCCPDLRLIGL
jgi:hypothetical protein